MMRHTSSINYIIFKQTSSTTPFKITFRFELLVTGLMTRSAATGQESSIATKTEFNFYFVGSY